MSYPRDARHDLAARILPPLCVAVALLLQTAQAAAVTACSGVATLEELVDCLTSATNMPARDSGGFVPPSAAEQDDWRAVVAAMLDASVVGGCNGIVVPASMAHVYEVTTFTDGDDAVDYCVLAELVGVGDPDKKGWGSFITNPDPVRELALQAVHPDFEEPTAQQSVGVFKTNRARSYLLSGAHRHANDVPSSCQGSYRESDPAHDVANMLQPTTEQLLDWYTLQGIASQLVVIQFHGMGSSTCGGVDIYMTYGLASGLGTPQLGDDLLKLQAEMRTVHPGAQIIVPGDALSCTLNATTNVQGRLLNGVDPSLVCGTPASAYGGRFISVEQKLGFRSAGAWVDAIAATWPTCWDDSECDDGEFCNGAEICDGDCRPGNYPCGAGACDELYDVCGAICGDGTCGADEDCHGCPSDCPSFDPSAASCGNGVCEAGDGEDCLSCPADCAGTMTGKPSSRFCCGFGGGYPDGCSDIRCLAGGLTCTEAPVGSGDTVCCGDLECGTPEDHCSCVLYCGAPPDSETSACADGLDNDCDGAVDCDDSECDGSDPACPAADCSTIGDKTSCNGTPGCRWSNKNQACSAHSG